MVDVVAVSDKQKHERESTYKSFYGLACVHDGKALDGHILILNTYVTINL